MVVFLPEINRVKASGTIYIRADGSVEGTDKIQRDGNVYTFVGDINGSIVVERDNIVVDGAGYTLQGAGSGTGMSLTSRSKVTIRNMEIKAFSDGIYLNSSSNNIISGNNITNNRLGIWFWIASNNTISGNNITANESGIELEGPSNYNNISGNNIMNNDVGIYFFGSSNKIIGNYIAKNGEGIYVGGHVPFAGSQNNIIYHNSFIHNTKQVNDRHWEDPFSAISVNIWDDGYPSGGNYWSDYEDRHPNATELDGSSIWNIPYVIDANNQDRYPLMKPIVIACAPTISIVSPENKTYTVSNVSLNFTVSKSTSWMGYSLDGQAIATITGNTTLSGLPAGSHSLTVYAKDTAGNTGTSETIYFSLAQQSEPFPTTWIAAAIAIIAIGVAITLGVAVYRRKRLTSSKTP